MVKPNVRFIKLLLQNIEPSKCDRGNWRWRSGARRRHCNEYVSYQNFLIGLSMYFHLINPINTKKRVELLRRPMNKKILQRRRKFSKSLMKPPSWSCLREWNPKRIMIVVAIMLVLVAASVVLQLIIILRILFLLDEKYINI